MFEEPVQEWMSQVYLFFKNKIIIMGDCLSQTAKHKGLPRAVKRIKPSLVKTPLADLEAQTQPHYLIFPSSYESFANTFEQRIRELFPNNVTVIRNRQDLITYDEDGRFNVLLVTCNRPQDAKHIRNLPNFHTFSQIGFAFNFDESLLGDSFKRSLGFRFGGFIKFTHEAMINFMTEAKETRSILFCHQDYGHINRTNLTFDFFFRRNHEYDKQDFFNWARLSGDSRDFIQRLQNTKSEDQLAKLILKNTNSHNTLCMRAVEMLNQTRNPCVLAHVAWLCSTLFDSIRASYPQSLKQLRQFRKQTIVAWVALSPQDIAAMKVDQNFMFSSFVVGSTKLEPPKPSHLGDKIAYQFNINLPSDLIEPWNQAVDMGLLFDQDTVIFNLQNMYRLVSFNHTDKIAEVTYCSVGPQYKKKIEDDRYKSRNTLENIRMMATYDAYWLNAFYIKSQLDLILSLQFYHQYKRSVLGELQIIATKHSIDLSTNGTTSLAQTAVSLIRQNLPLPSKALLQKIGDCELSTKNFQAAEECYIQMESIQRQFIKKLYLYYLGSSRQERGKFRETIEELKSFQSSKNRPTLGGLLGILEVTFKSVMEERSGNLNQSIKLNNANLSKLSNFFAVNYGKGSLLNLHVEAYELFYLQYLLTKVSCEFSKIRKEVGVELTQDSLEITLWKLDGMHPYLLPEDSYK